MQLLPYQPGVMQYWDQRAAYSHATMMFTGADVYLAMLDADEYICSPHLSSNTVQDILRKCIQEPKAVNMQVRTVHAFNAQRAVLFCHSGSFGRQNLDVFCTHATEHGGPRMVAPSVALKFELTHAQPIHNT